MRTFVGDYLALAAALRAGALGLHHAEHRLAHLRHHAGSVAMVASLVGCSALGTGSVALVALHIARNLEFLLHAVSYVFQCDTHLHAQVGTAVHAATSTLTASSATKHVAKYIAEVREDVVHRHSAAEATAAETAAHVAHVMAELVVTGTLVGVAEHVVSFSRLLEFLFSLLLLLLALALLAVGVILNGFLAVSFLQLIGSGVLAHAKHFIIISFFHRCSSPKYMCSSIFLHKGELLTHHHFSVAQHLVVDFVTLLHGVDHLALQFLVGGREVCYSLVKLGVKFSLVAVDGFHTVALEVFHEFVVDKFHAFAQAVHVGLLVHRL